MNRSLPYLAAVVVLVASACSGGSSPAADSETGAAEIDPVPDPGAGSAVVAVDFAGIDFDLGRAGAVVVEGDGAVVVAGDLGAARVDGTAVSRAGLGVDLGRSMALTGAGAVVGTSGGATVSQVPVGGGQAQLVAGAERLLASAPFAPDAPVQAAGVGLPLVLDVASVGDVVYAALRFDDPGAPPVSQVVRVQAGMLDLVAGSGPVACDAEPPRAVDAGLGRVAGIAAAPDGSVLVSDGECGRLWRVAPDGTLAAAASSGILVDPLDVVVAPDGTAYVLDLGRDAVMAVAPDGSTRPAVTGLTGADTSSQLALDPEGRLWITAGAQLLLARPA